MRTLYEKVALMSLGLLLVFGQGLTLARALEIAVSDNGSGSSSEVSTQVKQTTSVEQNNNAAVSNDVTQGSNTGDNSASENTGGDAAITTGDVNQQLSINTSVNSSAVNTECCPQSTNLSITGNGADSQNHIDVNQKNKTTVVINQNAKVNNNASGNANTGENKANSNTSGNVSIDTGNIKVSGGIENAPVNIASVRLASAGSALSAKISGNAIGSVNKIEADFINSTNSFLNFNADFNNFVNWNLNTGRNDANGNTGGSVDITTGDIDFNLFVKNLANIGSVEIKCCTVFDPGNPPNDDATPPGNPPGSSGNGNGDSGGGGSIASGVSTGGGIIGLSDTSSELAQAIFFWLGVVMIVTGAQLIGREGSGKISS